MDQLRLLGTEADPSAYVFPSSGAVPSTLSMVHIENGSWVCPDALVNNCLAVMLDLLFIIGGCISMCRWFGQLACMHGIASLFLSISFGWQTPRHHCFCKSMLLSGVCPQYV